MFFQNVNISMEFNKTEYCTVPFMAIKNISYTADEDDDYVISSTNIQHNNHDYEVPEPILKLVHKLRSLDYFIAYLNRYC